MSPIRPVLLALVLSPLAFNGCACDDPQTTPDGGTPGADAGGGDAGADGGAGSTFSLTRAFSADGLTVLATFGKPVDAASVQPEDFVLTSDAGTVSQSITGAAVDGAQVTLTLDGALPKGATYQLAAADLSSEDGDTIAPGAVDLEGTLYLALIWHQHQPVYIDPSGEWEWSRGPWVRKHATKDYYDMVAMLADFPDIHVQVNLTPVLLMQLQDYYVDRLAPYVDTTTDTVDAAGYFAQRPEGATEPVTDPWIDMLLQPTPAPGDLTEEQRGWFYADIWSNFSISEVMIERFPPYAALRDKRNEAPETFTQDDLRNMKCWFQLSWFDPRFMRGPVTMPDGLVVDLSDLVTEEADGTFTLDQPFTEEICQRLVVEEYKVLKNVVAAHRELMYEADTRQGQVEVMTTPFYHPILPLLVDTDLAKQAMPSSPMPSQRFQYPEDADVHVAKAVKLYREQFGRDPTGMWPAEGSVAEAVVPIFERYGVRWIATDRRVLEKSTPPDQPIYSPYRIDSDTVTGDGGDTGDELAIVFRDTEISDKIGFHYQGGTPEENVADLLESLARHQPRYGQDGLLSIILDGENAWEWYRLDNDAIGFLEGMYTALTEAQEKGEIRTVTVSEYLDGNEARGVPAHPVSELPELEPLFAASWISGSFSTWIGEEEENLAWDYLAAVRADLAGFETEGLTRPDPMADPPAEDTTEWYRYKAWESMYAAEGSDWFWWYGSDQTAAGGDEPFDRIFLALLQDVYRNAQLAGITTEVPDLPPVLRTCEPPAGPLSSAPAIDGEFVPDATEWTGAGSGVCMDIDSGTQVNPDDVIGTWYHGIFDGALYLALEMNEDVSARLGSDFQLRLYFSQKHIVSVDPPQTEQDPAMETTRAGEAISFSAGGAAREVTIDFGGTDPVAQLAVTDGTAWGTPAPEPTIAAAVVREVVELRIPLASLGWQQDDPLEMLVTAVADGTEMDRAPNLNSIVVFSDRSLMVELTFILDATGSKLALEAVKPIDNPPPPAGTGTVFIVGEGEALGNWTPNTVPMADDGSTHGDETAGDNFWTFTYLVPPGTEVNYKYTIGDPGAGWGPTEEFPLTNRGFEVKDTNGNRRMILRDVFADRPNPSGSLPPLTEILDP